MDLEDINVTTAAYKFKNALILPLLVRTSLTAKLLLTPDSGIVTAEFLEDDEAGKNAEN